MPIDAGQLLRDEYFQLQKTVEDFDGRSLTIKAWSATLSTSGIGLAYQQKNPDLLLAAAAAALAFWLIDWIWKMHQQAFYGRIEAIEAAYATAYEAGEDAPPKLAPLQILAGWRGSYRIGNLWARGFRAFWYPGVFLPHLPVETAALVLWLRETGNAPRLLGLLGVAG
jgi:hypothetical protein